MFSCIFIILLLLISVVTDLTFEKIPNWLICIGFLGSCINFLVERFEIWVYCMDMILIFFIVYMLFLIGSIGAGDAKLLIVIAGVAGYTQTISILLISFLIGAVLSIIKILYQVFIKEISFEKFKHLYIHFSIPIALATLYIYIFGGSVPWISFS